MYVERKNYTGNQMPDIKSSLEEEGGPIFVSGPLNKNQRPISTERSSTQ